MSTRYTGIVKWFNTKSGFGFIESLDADEDIFVHFSALSGGEYNYLVQGEYVEFNTIASDKYKCQASHVTGIRGNKLMCETRRDAKREYESKHVEEVEKVEVVKVDSVKKAYKKPFDKTSTTPENWTLVNKNKDKDKDKDVRVPRQKSVGRKA